MDQIKTDLSLPTLCLSKSCIIRKVTYMQQICAVWAIITNLNELLIKILCLPSLVFLEMKKNPRFFLLLHSEKQLDKFFFFFFDCQNILSVLQKEGNLLN